MVNMSTPDAGQADSGARSAGEAPAGGRGLHGTERVLSREGLTLPAYLRLQADRLERERGEAVVGPSLVVALWDAAAELERKRAEEFAEEFRAAVERDYREAIAAGSHEAFDTHAKRVFAAWKGRL